MKVLTWNLNCEGDYSNRIKNIIELVKSEDPDIICFQEIKYGSYDLIISSFEGYNYKLDKRVKYNRMYGEMILTKFNILESNYISYSNSPNIRGLTYYKLNNFYVLTTHLEHSNKYNDKNTEELKSVVDNIDNFVLLGDFNYYDKSKLDYNQVHTDNTYESNLYNSKPDRIYFNNFEVTNSKTIKTTLSDHYPLICDLKKNN